MREETMKAIIVTLATTIIGAGAAYAASETVTMNAIDAPHMSAFGGKADMVIGEFYENTFSD